MSEYHGPLSFLCVYAIYRYVQDATQAINDKHIQTEQQHDNSHSQRHQSPGTVCQWAQGTAEPEAGHTEAFQRHEELPEDSSWTVGVGRAGSHTALQGIRPGVSRPGAGLWSAQSQTTDSTPGCGKQDIKPCVVPGGGGQVTLGVQIPAAKCREMTQN